MAMARARKGHLIEVARRVLVEPNMVAVAALTRADVPSMTAARSAFRQQSVGVKKLPNSLCGLAVQGSEREFLSGLFSGDLVVLYPTDDETDASTLAKRMLAGAKGAKNVMVVGGALEELPLQASDFEAISKMPHISELRAEVARAIRAPLVNVGRAIKQPTVKLAKALKAPSTKLARGFDAKARQEASSPEA